MTPIHGTKQFNINKMIPIHFITKIYETNQLNDTELFNDTDQLQKQRCH